MEIGGNILKPSSGTTTILYEGFKDGSPHHQIVQLYRVGMITNFRYSCIKHIFINKHANKV